MNKQCDKKFKRKDMLKQKLEKYGRKCKINKNGFRIEVGGRPQFISGLVLISKAMNALKKEEQSHCNEIEEKCIEVRVDGKKKCRKKHLEKN